VSCLFSWWYVWAVKEIFNSQLYKFAVIKLADYIKEMHTINAQERF